VAGDVDQIRVLVSLVLDGVEGALGLRRRGDDVGRVGRPRQGRGQETQSSMLPFLRISRRVVEVLIIYLLGLCSVEVWQGYGTEA